MNGTLLKFVGAAAIYAALYALVWSGKLDPKDFLNLAEIGLAALGIHAAVTTPFTK